MSTLFQDNQLDWTKSAGDSGPAFNAFEIVNPHEFAWEVAFYRVTSKTKKVTRSVAKNAAWEARERNKGRGAKGLGYIVDIADDQVVVPAAWSFDERQIYDGCSLRREETQTVRPGPHSNPNLVCRILEDAMRWHFRKTGGAQFGQLWRDYGDFCQMPPASHGRKNANNPRFSFCRRMGLQVRALAGNRWAVQFLASTAAIDGRPLSVYYAQGQVEQLHEMVEAKRLNRLDRRSHEVNINVWHDQRTKIGQKAEVLTLTDPEIFAKHAELEPLEQRALGRDKLECHRYEKPAKHLPLENLYLLLDSQITGQDHRETILEPAVRIDVAMKMRAAINGCDVFGAAVQLASELLPVDSFDHQEFLPPPLYICGERGVEILPAPRRFEPSLLAERARQRAERVRRFGFLNGRTLNPLLAYPDNRLSARDAGIVQGFLNDSFREQGIEFGFERALAFRSVDQIQRVVRDDGYDCAFVLLPESRRSGRHANSVHRKLKKTLQIPSQCIHWDNALPPLFHGLDPRQMRHEAAHVFRRVQRQLDLSLSNLLVKANCIPFVSAASYHYNVHLALDVGGRANNKVMACLAHNLARPGEIVSYMPREISVDAGQSEPIPADSLYDGLERALEELHAELTAAGIRPDFSTLLVLRDGELLGDGDRWNERDALVRLRDMALARGWIDETAIWTAAEIMKNAEGWRVFEPGNPPRNPVVGSCYFPFADPHEALVSTTGRPFLPHGTAAPLRVRWSDIQGRARREHVLRDIVWEADMCFTKMDMAEKLPWSLHIADVGALQLAHAYQPVGVTV